MRHLPPKVVIPVGHSGSPHGVGDQHQAFGFGIERSFKTQKMHVMPVEDQFRPNIGIGKNRADNSRITPLESTHCVKQVRTARETAGGFNDTDG